ncbi:MAG TPA: UDP-N-acetylmuramoyl-tripeptide--D-alanyl-D-alanine ligase [Bacteroidia bacterium]|jgi:UDP-N-acetylmuramoyl-tripeptide--D-alanyl-D-alanine ligase|nr:UDP-N-acetylmuramoyl-tripeptide--D-alanyl-D-alanine ligase [Bacteroidia bacterium]HQK98905.1 UDP-N-acetylmuramoyl-tripeptide--D-alanyl-D-alanine ligase [Bacteroidia bacterium]
MISIEKLYEIFKSHPVVSTDTRKFTKDCLFFALKGANFNGNLFAHEALKGGAAYAIVDELHGEADERILLTDDVLSTLQKLATHHRRELNIPVLGITGSNGKTTTKELVAAVLKQKFNTYYTIGNLNNHIGVPLTLLSLTKEHEFAVVEMGANHQKEIELLASIAQPDFGLITNIGKAHLEGFGGIEGVKKGKGELYDFLKAHKGLIFIQHDREALVEILNGYENIVTYGTSETNAVCGSVAMQGELLAVEVTKPFHQLISTQLTGDYNIDNVLCAVTIGHHFGVDANKIADAISGYVPGNQRSQVIHKGDITIVLDAYNANPSSMTAALMNFRNAFSGDKYLALGEMLELGDESAGEHHRIASLATTVEAKQTLVVGKHFAASAHTHGFLHFNTSEEAAQWLKQNLPHNAAILIKGSRGSKMEELLKAFD